MIKPQGSKILIKVDEKTETKSGIKIISNTHIITEDAEILAIGPEVSKVKIGDRIMFKTWVLDQIKIGEETHHFLDEKDILAICE